MKHVCKVLITVGMTLTVEQSENNGEFFLHESNKNTREPLTAFAVEEAIFAVLDSYAEGISIYPKVVAVQLWMEALTADLLIQYPKIVKQVAEKRLEAFV